MKLLDADTGGGRVLEAAIVSLFFLLVFYADFILLKTTPMLAARMVLMDPVVSFANFEPSFRVLQYELFQHHNLLWSNLRSMGLPLLANDIHAAPMFPLTLLLVWLPAEYFWNIFVVARLLLMGAGTYLLARDFLKLRSIPAAFFVLCFIYSQFVLQWLNHSWQNGLLAGIWYLYFLYLLTESSRLPYAMKRFLVVLGLTICVYAMVTCGFPEASAMFAVLVVLVYTPFVISLLLSGRIRPVHFMVDLLIAHAVGFALSAAQIFSIFEMLALFEAAEKRGLYGLRQFPMDDFIPFWAEKIALIPGAKASLFKDSRTYLGLVPLFFFVLGMAWTAGNLLKTGYRQIGALLCAAFIILKFFPFWDGFNTVVGSLPVLKESYFFVYFLTIFLWGFAFFVAQGVQVVLYENKAGAGPAKYGRPLFALAGAAAVVCLLWLSVPVVYGVSVPEWLRHTPGHAHLLVLSFFAGAFLVVQLFLNSAKLQKLPVMAGMFLMLFGVLEMFVILPRDFNPLPRGSTQQSMILARDLEDSGINPAEVRIQDPDGIYVSGGVATVDNGAPAVLPVRLFVFRRTLFDVRGGYFPAREAYYDYSWALTSTALFTTGEMAGPVSPAWGRPTTGDTHTLYIDAVRIGDRDFAGSRETITGSQRLYLKGWAADVRGKVIDTPPAYVVFRSGEEEIALPTRRMYRLDVVSHFADSRGITAGWEAEIAAELLKPGTYRIIVRAGRPGGVYFEVDSGRMVTVAAVPGGEKASAAPENRDSPLAAATTKGYVHHDSMALPRAYLAARCFPVDHFSESVRRIGDSESFRLGDVHVEELSEAEKIMCRAIEAAGPARVPITHDRGREVGLAAVAGPGLLVLNDTYYPGWQAFDRISGEQLVIRPANIATRALVLPEEREYRIIFQYAPQWLTKVRLLLWTSLSILAALFLYAFYSWSKQKK